MRIRRFAAALTGAGLVVLGSTSAMAASPSQAYPPVAPSLTVSANSIVAGGSVIVTAKGFLSFSTASVTWTGAGALGVGGKAFGAAAGGFRMGAKSTAADAVGVVTASIRLISVGDHTITVAGTAATGSAVSLSTVVTVTAAVAPSGNLPHTGAPLLLYTAAGLMLVLLGGLVVMVVRSRRRSSTVPAPATAAPFQPVGR